MAFFLLCGCLLGLAEYRPQFDDLEGESDLFCGM